MKLTNHELLLLTNEDYRENVLRSQCGIESAQNIINNCDDLTKLKEVKNNGRRKN